MQRDAVVVVDGGPNLESRLLTQYADTFGVVHYLYLDVGCFGHVRSAGRKGSSRCVPGIAGCVVELYGRRQPLDQGMARSIIGRNLRCAGAVYAWLLLSELDVPLAAGQHVLDRFAVGEQTVEFVTVCAGFEGSRRVVLDREYAGERVIRVVPVRRFVSVDAGQLRELHDYLECEGYGTLVLDLGGDGYIDRVLDLFACRELVDDGSDLFGRQRPGECGGGFVGSNVEVIDELGVFGLRSAFCGDGPFGVASFCFDHGSAVGCEELILRHAIFADLAEHLVYHFIPKEFTGEFFAAERIVESLQNT